MDAQILLLKERLVPAPSVHRWMTNCDRWLKDKRESVSLLEWLKQER